MQIRTQKKPIIVKYGGDGVIEGQSAKDLMDTGKDSSGNEFNHTGFGQSLLGAALQYIALVLDTVPIAVQSMINLITVNPRNAGKDNFIDSAADATLALFDKDNRYSIKKAVFNEISVFNINVFNMGDSYTVGVKDPKTINQSSIIVTLKENVAVWFYTCRTLAVMLNAIVLVYVGIRMAISSVASEQAKYKKMLIDWAVSIVIIFLLPYMMILIIKLYETMLNILYAIREAVTQKGETSFEDEILDSIYRAFEFEGGMRIFMYSLFFWFLTFMHIKFFIAYFKRTFNVFFLTIIAPFITVTYPIDKIGDGRAQAFRQWLAEYLINVLIQPIHAAIYIVFVFTAGKIAEEAPFVAMIFLLSLNEIEKIVRKVFGTPASVAMKGTGLKKGKN